MAIDIGAIQGLITLKDEYTETLEKVHHNLEKFGGEHTAWVQSLVSGQGLVATAFVAAGAVIGAELIALGNEAEQVGAQIGRMGLMFNVPVGAISDLRFAVIAAGGDFDTFGNSMFMFQKRIEDNGDAVDKGLQKLGLNIRDIRELRPDEQFLRISDAVRGAGENVNKSAVAFEIFGRQGRDILPLLLKPLSQLTEESEKLGASWTDREVTAAKEFRFELSKMAAEAEEAWISLGRDVAPVTNQLTLAWQRMKLAMANVALTAIELISLKPIAGWLGENALAAEEAGARQDVINKAMSLGAKEGIKYAEAVEFVNKAYGYESDSAEKATAKLKELREQAIVPLTSAQEDEILELNKFGVSVKEISDLTGVNVVAVKQLIDVTKEHAEEAKKAAAERVKAEEAAFKVEEKSIRETAKLWDDYFELRTKHSGTTIDTQIAGINAWFNEEVGKLDDSDKNWQAHYDAIAAVAREKLNDVMVDWDFLAEHSIEALQQQAEVARNTYEEMIFGSQHFTREALEAQLAKVHEAEDAARGLGDAFVESQHAAANAVDETTIKIRTLAGELITLEEAQKRQSQGGSSQIPELTQFEIDRTPGGADALLDELDNLARQMAIPVKSEAEYYARLKIEVRYHQLLNAYDKLKTQAKRKHTGFAEGGMVDIAVGEQGPEVVRVPLGSIVMPTGMNGSAGSSGPSITNHYYVNGSAEDVARKISQIFMRDLKMQMKFPAA